MSRVQAIFSILFFSTILSGQAQGVSFVRADWLLAPATGHVPFVDCAVDLDGDFRDDVLRIGREGLFIDFQVAAGSFSQHFFPLPPRVVPTWSICAGDLDNDGYNDLLFAGDSAVSFILARDHGQRYVESVMPGYLLCQRSTLADIDLDGWLDAFVCNDKGRSGPYRNLGQGLMQPDTMLVRTADRAGNYAAIWTDFDNDGDADLYITKCQAGAPPGHINRTNLLYRNNGDGTFTETAEAAGVADNAQSWATVFEDFDNDGDFDAFVVNHDQANRLYRNNGDGTFTDVIAGSGIDPADLAAFENTAGDFNNDGYVDIFAQLEREIYLGHGDLTFTGIDVPVTPGAIADLNGDGWLDVFHLDQAWINQPGENHWLKVAVIGVDGNRNGIGSRIEIHGDWGRQVREIRAGQSYTPMSSLNAHFGLGSSGHIDSVVVQWPSGMQTILRDLPSDTLLVIAEASCNRPMVDLAPAGPVHLCMGDTLALSAPPGFGSYRWLHGPDERVLAVDRPGTYRALCFDTAGCVSVSQVVRVFERKEEAPVILSPEGTVFCPGDSVTLVVRNGHDPIWSNGISDAFSIRVGEPGPYSVSVLAECTNGELISPVVRIDRLPVDLPVPGDVIILPNDSIQLSAEGEDLHWFDQPTGGNLLHVGAVWQAALQGTSVTYYVEDHVHFQGGAQAGGKVDTAGIGGLPLQNGHLVFDIYSPCVLESVTVYVPSGMPPGVRFIQLWSRDSLVTFRRVDVVEGANLLMLDFALDTGQYLLVCPQGGLLGNSGSLAYPYPLGDFGHITTSSTGIGSYYSFYDWSMRGPSLECVSGRVPVEILLSGMEAVHWSRDIRIFPQPAQLLVKVRWSSGMPPFSEFHVLDGLGRIILSGFPDGGQEMSLDLAGWGDGLYWLRLMGQGDAAVRPILKISRSGN